MASDESHKATPKEGKPAEPARHPYGPRPVGALLPALLRPVFRRRAPATAQVLADWELIVGRELAAGSTPRKLFGGTLTVVCSGPVAMEMQHYAPEIMARINGYLGRVAVSRLRFQQDILPAPPPPPPPPRPAAVGAAKKAVADLPPGGLRDALERLGSFVLSQRRG